MAVANPDYYWIRIKDIYKLVLGSFALLLVTGAIGEAIQGFAALLFLAAVGIGPFAFVYYTYKDKQALAARHGDVNERHWLTIAIFMWLSSGLYALWYTFVRASNYDLVNPGQTQTGTQKLLTAGQSVVKQFSDDSSAAGTSSQSQSSGSTTATSSSSSSSSSSSRSASSSSAPTRSTSSSSSQQSASSSSRDVTDGSGSQSTSTSEQRSNTNLYTDDADDETGNTEVYNPANDGTSDSATAPSDSASDSSDTKFCSYCGIDLRPHGNLNFCPECGTETE